MIMVNAVTVQHDCWGVTALSFCRLCPILAAWSFYPFFPLSALTVCRLTLSMTRAMPT
jgi:hypothetical protein